MPKVHKIIIAIASVGVSLAALFFFLNWQARTSYAKVDQEANRITSFLQKADGVIKTQQPKSTLSGATITGRGNGLFASGCGIDVKCPSVDSRTIVEIPRGGEKKFFDSILKLSGYDSLKNAGCYNDQDGTFQSCMSGGIASGSSYYVSFSLEVADPYHHGAPTQDDGVSQTVWRYLSISVTTK